MPRLEGEGTTRTGTPHPNERMIRLNIVWIVLVVLVVLAAVYFLRGRA